MQARLALIALILAGLSVASGIAGYMLTPRSITITLEGPPPAGVEPVCEEVQR